MLLVKTKLLPSSIHGIGLFADEFISVGREVLRFEQSFDIEKTLDEVAKMSQSLQEWIRTYGYLDFHFNRYIILVDDARFINHSDNPNIYQDYSKDFYGVDIALRDIQIGEEITANYNTFEKGNKFIV